jgi:hypothetical protein
MSVCPQLIVPLLSHNSRYNVIHPKVHQGVYLGVQTDSHALLIRWLTDTIQTALKGWPLMKVYLCGRRMGGRFVSHLIQRARPRKGDYFGARHRSSPAFLSSCPDLPESFVRAGAQILLDRSAKHRKPT